MKNRTVFSLVALLLGTFNNALAIEPPQLSSLSPVNNFPGLIVGRIWHDRNGDGDSRGENAIARARVYIDENDNGIRDPGESSTLTGTSGYYAFFDVPAGEHVIRQELDFGWRNTDAASPIQLSSKEDNAVIQIIGGNETQADEYPFMVALGFESFGLFYQFCGGVLISDRWVATAAHCSEGVDPLSVSVLAGTNDITDGSGQLLSVSDIHIHPEYLTEPSVPGGPFSVAAGYDIALWELDKPVLLQQGGLQSIAMLSSDEAYLAEDGVLATAVGWGVNDLDSLLLQDVHLPVYDSEACASIYSSSINFETQICGGVPEGGIDACQGDSGGPLLVRDYYQDKWKLAGITSYGNGCALPENPGVWARTSTLSDWVRSTAVEPSYAQRVIVQPGGLIFASFANTTTRYEPRTSIAPRWQLVNVDITEATGGELRFDWRILDESPWPRLFDCELDVDSGASIPAVFSDCYSGENWYEQSPLQDGIYVSSLTVASGNTSFTRENTFVVGIPPESVTYGELTESDATDPDFPDSFYYIDHFNLEGLSGEKVVAIQIEPTGFDAFVGLYDRDVRERDGAGGLISYFFSPVFGGVAEHIFVPDPNTNYMIGVSSFFTEGVGEYTVKVLNEGEAVPTELGSNNGRILKAFQKLPKARTVIQVPPLRP